MLNAPRRRRRLRSWLLGAAVVVSAGCDAAPATHGGALFPVLRVERVAPAPLLPGTTLEVYGGGFVSGDVARYEVAFEGALGAVEGVWTYEAERSGPSRLDVTPGDDLWAALPDDQGRFSGDVVVRRVIGEDVREARAPLTLSIARRITPSLRAFVATELYLGDRVELHGEGFLIAGEGTSLLRLDGAFTTTSPADTTRISGLFVPASALPGFARQRLAFTLTPDIFGVRPGTFEGIAQVINVSGADGAERASEIVGVEGLALRAPVVDEVTPLSASRGQRVTVRGRGLLPADPLAQTAAVLVLEGVFTPHRGAPIAHVGVGALALYPESHRGADEAVVVLRAAIDEGGGLSGLGARPGVFEGRVTPLVLWGDDAVEGASLPLTLEVKNPRQVVHVRFLPSFADALSAFGLLAERDAIEARIFEVLARSYEGVNIAFTDARPEAWAEYAVVEVGGADPNGSHLFGLDNTTGKDVGNLRFDDVIGGFNAETRARNYAAYGGIFVAELRNLSPTLGVAHPLASPRFDDIFSPVILELGGSPARAGEASEPGARGAAVAEAARVLGNLVGGTIAHEVGHSLGLAAVDGEVHNVGDNPAWIMDAGVFRPFAERAEIDGAGPEVFSPQSRAYLEGVLPLDVAH